MAGKGQWESHAWLVSAEEKKQSNKAEVSKPSIGDTLQSRNLGGDGKRDRNMGTTLTS